MKTLIASAFALVLLGAGAANAQDHRDNMGAQDNHTMNMGVHHVVRHHRHQVCTFRHHHRVCTWR